MRVVYLHAEIFSMYISAKQVASSKVFDADGHLLGQLARVRVNPDNGQILAFEMSCKGACFISPHDVLNWKNEYLLLGQDYEIHHAQDLVRLSECLKNGNTDLIGKKVRTEGGTQLGFVTDYSLDSRHMVLSSITVQKSFLGLFSFDTRLIHQANIVEIRPKIVIVRDSWMKVPARNSPGQFDLRNSPTLDQALSVPEDQTCA